MASLLIGKAKFSLTLFLSYVEASNSITGCPFLSLLETSKFTRKLGS